MKETDYNRYTAFLLNNEKHSKQICLATLLINRESSISDIKYLTELTSEKIRILRLYVGYFGYDVDYKMSWSEIENKVNEKMKEIEAELERIRQEEWNRFYNKIIRFFSSILSALVVIPSILLILFFDILVYIPKFIASKIFVTESEGNKVEVTNNIVYREGASNNNSVQKIIISNESKSKQGDKIVLTGNNDIDLAKKLTILIMNGSVRIFEYNMITWLYKIGITINSIPFLNDKVKRKIILFISLSIILYLASSITIKTSIGTIFVIFFGITVTVVYDKCGTTIDIPEPTLVDTGGKVEDASLTETELDSLSKGSDGMIKEDESVVDEPEAVDVGRITDYGEYYRSVQALYQDLSSCQSLSEIGTAQRNFFSKRDFVDHYSKDYVIKDTDGEYYLHVVVYNSIKEAVYQMHYISQNSKFVPKVLPVGKLQKKYAVVIGKHKGIEVNDICDLASSWELYCTSQSNKIGIYYNR